MSGQVDVHPAQKMQTPRMPQGVPCCSKKLAEHREQGQVLGGFGMRTLNEKTFKRGCNVDASALDGRPACGSAPLPTAPTSTHWRPTLEPRVQHVCSACAPRVHHVCTCIFTHILNLRLEGKICYHLIIMRKALARPLLRYSRKIQVHTWCTRGAHVLHTRCTRAAHATCPRSMRVWTDILQAASIYGFIFSCYDIVTVF